LRQRELRVLELGDRSPKRLAFLRVRDGVFEHLFRTRLRHDRHAEPLLLELLHQHHEAATLLTQQVLSGHPTIVERELRGVLAFHAHLLEPAAPDETWPVPLDDEQGQAAMRIVGILRPSGNNGQVAGHSVGDERLRTVDHILVPVALCRSCDASQIGTCPRLGHCERSDRLAAHTAGQQLCLLLGITKRVNVRNDDVGVQAGRPAGLVDSAKLLHDDHRMKEVAAGTSVLLLHPGAEETRLTGLQPDLPVDDSLLPPFRLLGHDPGFRELSEVAPKDVVFFRK
jgi:hypothetical protein